MSESTIPYGFATVTKRTAFTVLRDRSAVIRQIDDGRRRLMALDAELGRFVPHLYDRKRIQVGDIVFELIRADYGLVVNELPVVNGLDLVVPEPEVDVTYEELRVEARDAVEARNRKDAAARSSQPDEFPPIKGDECGAASAEMHLINAE